MVKIKKIDKDPEIGCLMLNFKFKNWLKFVENIVDEKDLYKPDDDDFGYCKYAHTTILFGLHDYDGITDDIKEYLPELDELDDIKIKKISLFENDDYDVVKFDVKSKKLKKLNKEICDEFEYTNEYDYHPHMTVAYVKKGMGKKYIDDDVDVPEIKNLEYVYSGPEPKYKKTTITV